MNARFTTGPRLMVGACLVGFGLAGCQSSGTSRTLMAEEPAMPQSEYVIGPGDTLQIFVWQHPEVSVTIPVRPDGRVSTPLVEDVVAVGKTPTQLSRDLEVQIGQYIREPTVNVIVTSFIGTFGNQVRVVGQAVQPQAIPFRQDMTLLDVIIQVGGLSPNAAGNRATIPAKMINEMPFPIPRSVICSPSHIKKPVPAVKVMTVIRRNPHPALITKAP